MIISDPKNGTLDDWNIGHDSCFCHNFANNSSILRNGNEGGSNQSSGIVLSKFL